MNEAKQLAAYVSANGLSWAAAQTLLSAQWCYFWDGLSGTDPERFGESFGLILLSSAGVGGKSLISGSVAGLSGPPTRASLTLIKFSVKSLNHSISRGHSPDFGVKGNWSKSTGQALQSAITKHCRASGTMQIRGFFRGKDAIFFTDKSTGLTAIFDGQGNFIGGWLFSKSQMHYLMTTGRVN